ncbi:MAG: OmpA family protein [Vicinamibacterales bacterium]
MDAHRLTLGTLASLLALSTWLASASAAASIPLCEGLTIVTAIEDPKGDYESVKRVTRVTSAAVDLMVAGDRPIGSSIRRILVPRTFLRDDLRNATFYLHYFDNQAPVTVPGSTAIGTSTAVLSALKNNGVAEISVINPIARAAQPEEMRKNLWPYTIRRVATLTVPVIVNGRATELPAIQARGDNMGDLAEFVFLDEEANPLTLKYRFGNSPKDEGGRLQVVQIAYQCAGETTVSGSRLERALLEEGRADVYELYFEFNSARLREVSEPTLQEIADVLKRHPDWRLSIEGHTDSIASDTYNMELSQRRASAVKDALVTKHVVDPVRLTPSGLGESRPKDRNDTLEGRARNRRVELVRQR